MGNGSAAGLTALPLLQKENVFPASSAEVECLVLILNVSLQWEGAPPRPPAQCIASGGTGERICSKRAKPSCSIRGTEAHPPKVPPKVTACVPQGQSFAARLCCRILVSCFAEVEQLVGSRRAAPWACCAVCAGERTG